MTDDVREPTAADATIAAWAEKLGTGLDRADGTAEGSVDEAREDYHEFLLETFPPAEDQTVTAVELDGFDAEWITPANAIAGRTLLYLHGGGYVLGGPKGYRGWVGSYAAALRARALVPNYRLAPEHPFPAAVDDCTAAYRYLLSEGVDPGGIVISGDSAGGAMSVTVPVNARDLGLPLPAVSISISPWANLEHTGQTWKTKDGIDPVCNVEGVDRFAAAFLGGAPADSPLASPVFADVSGLPPTLILVGEREGMLSDAVRLAGHLGEARVRTRLDLWPEMVHVWPMVARQLPESERAVRDAVAFAEEYLAAG